jgi:hypothetical protein
METDRRGDWQVSNPASACCLTRRYFSDEFTEVNLPLRAVPIPLTAVMMTMLMPTAIRQYSIAVAPVSSSRNFEISRSIQNSCRPFPAGIPHHDTKSSSGLVADALRNALNNRLRLWSVFSGCADENSGNALTPVSFSFLHSGPGQRYFKDNLQEFGNWLFVEAVQSDLPVGCQAIFLSSPVCKNISVSP